MPEYNEIVNPGIIEGRICRRVFYLSTTSSFAIMKKKKRKEEEEADLGGSVSRHVSRVYNELSGLWKNLEREVEKILIPGFVDGFCEGT